TPRSAATVSPKPTSNLDPGVPWKYTSGLPAGSPDSRARTSRPRTVSRCSPIAPPCHVEGWRPSAPPQGGGEMGQHRLQHVGVVVDAELVRDGDEQRVGGGDRLVLGKLLDQPVRLAGVALAEARPTTLQVADLVA